MDFAGVEHYSYSPFFKTDSCVSLRSYLLKTVNYGNSALIFDISKNSPALEIQNGADKENKIGTFKSKFYKIVKNCKIELPSWVWFGGGGG